MRLKVLVGILVFLIIVNLATIGTFLWVHFSRDVPEKVYRFGPRRGMRSFPEKAPGVGGPMRFRTGEREKLRTLFSEFRNETQDLRDRVGALERETFELMHEDPVPVGQVDSLLKEISLVEYEISKRAAAKLIEAKKVLPPDQQSHFFNAIHRSHMMMRGGPGQHGPRRGQRHQRESFQPDSMSSSNVTD
jgi:hypothetical protein